MVDLALLKLKHLMGDENTCAFLQHFKHLELELNWNVGIVNVVAFLH